MNTKHASGPWGVVIRDRDRQLIKKASNINDSYWVDNDTGISIANVGLSTPNAYLIAAAPELLACLKHIHACIVYNDGPEINLRINEIKDLSHVIALAEKTE